MGTSSIPEPYSADKLCRFVTACRASVVYRPRTPTHFRRDPYRVHNVKIFVG
ncbi:MAG: hypothetical protein IK117_07345 [Bacteroidales bacterium]|nr:hypothetical protein [Bacteroidales bacterium]